MDDKLFKQKLSEVADWEIPKSPRETSLNAKKKRGRKSAEDEYMELREEIFQEEFDGVNQTMAPLLLRVKVQPTTCDDCGDICPNGRQKEKKLSETGKGQVKTWRERCLTCNKTKNPFTGQFDLSPQESSYVWTTFLRETKGLYKSKYSQARKVILSPDAQIVNEDDENIIIKYPESKQEK